MKLNELRDNPGATKTRKRVGRGIASGTGKTSGRGHKGQKSRSGVSLLGFEGGQMPLYRRLPKRGFNNPFAKDFAIINIGQLQKAVDAGKIDAKQAVTGKSLLEAGLVKKSRNGVRLLAKGDISAKLEIKVAGASKAAIEAIEKAGGKVVLPEPQPKPEGKGKARHRPKAAKTEGGGDKASAKAESKGGGDKKTGQDQGGADDSKGGEEKS